MSGHQPKELTELAFASFTAYMKEQALQFLKWMEVPLPCAEIEIKALGTCRELKDFFHDTKLPTVLANEITKRLLTVMDMFSVIYESTRKDYFEQNLMTLVELFMHPDVTSIELGPGYLYETGYEYCNFILRIILKNVSSLQNLKTLNVGLGINIHLEGLTLVFPSQLKELTVCGTFFFYNYNLKSIAQCCQELKSLKIMRCSISDSFIKLTKILKLNRLETLHLLRDFNSFLMECPITKPKVDPCVALINGISADATSDVLSASTLKSFGLTISEESSLQLIVDKLPHLTEIILTLPRKCDVSCLTQLKNLRSLTLEAADGTSDDYKKILPVLGKSLVSLDLRGYNYLDLEFIGETCSNLRCLHVRTNGPAYSKAQPKPSLKIYPNFRTVERLKVRMSHDYEWMEFIIVQCLNIKVLSAIYSWEPDVIRNVLKRTSLSNLEEIHLYPGLRNDSTCLEELCLRCPNLRLVHGLGSDSFISRKVVFDTNGCRKNSCETCHSLNILDAPRYRSETEDLGCNYYIEGECY